MAEWAFCSLRLTWTSSRTSLQSMLRSEGFPGICATKRTISSRWCSFKSLFKNMYTLCYCLLWVFDLKGLGRILSWFLEVSDIWDQQKTTMNTATPKASQRLDFARNIPRSYLPWAGIIRATEKPSKVDEALARRPATDLWFQLTRLVELAGWVAAS